MCERTARIPTPIDYSDPDTNQPSPPSINRPQYTLNGGRAQFQGLNQSFTPIHPTQMDYPFSIDPPATIRYRRPDPRPIAYDPENVIATEDFYLGTPEQNPPDYLPYDIKRHGLPGRRIRFQQSNVPRQIQYDPENNPRQESPLNYWTMQSPESGHQRYLEHELDPFSPIYSDPTQHPRNFGQSPMIRTPTVNRNIVDMIQNFRQNESFYNEDEDGEVEFQDLIGGLSPGPGNISMSAYADLFAGILGPGPANIPIASPSYIIEVTPNQNENQYTGRPPVYQTPPPIQSIFETSIPTPNTYRQLPPLGISPHVRLPYFQDSQISYMTTPSPPNLSVIQELDYIPTPRYQRQPGVSSFTSNPYNPGQQPIRQYASMNGLNPNMVVNYDQWLEESPEMNGVGDNVDYVPISPPAFMYGPPIPRQTGISSFTSGTYNPRPQMTRQNVSMNYQNPNIVVNTDQWRQPEPNLGSSIAPNSSSNVSSYYPEVNGSGNNDLYMPIPLPDVTYGSADPSQPSCGYSPAATSRYQNTPSGTPPGPTSPVYYPPQNLSPMSRSLPSPPVGYPNDGPIVSSPVTCPRVLTKFPGELSPIHSHSPQGFQISQESSELTPMNASPEVETFGTYCNRRIREREPKFYRGDLLGHPVPILNIASTFPREQSNNARNTEGIVFFMNQLINSRLPGILVKYFQQGNLPFRSCTCPEGGPRGITSGAGSQQNPSRVEDVGRDDGSFVSVEFGGTDG